MVNEVIYYGNFKEYSYNEYDIRKFMDNVFKFYYFMTKSSDVSPNVKSYVNNLSGKKLVCFHNQMKEPLKFINNDDFLFFYLDVIINDKNDFKDLSFEFYLYYYIDRSYPDNVINLEWRDILSKRYRKEINEFEEKLYQEQLNQ